MFTIVWLPLADAHSPQRGVDVLNLQPTHDLSGGSAQPTSYIQHLNLFIYLFFELVTFTSLPLFSEVLVTCSVSFRCFSHLHLSLCHHHPRLLQPTVVLTRLGSSSYMFCLFCCFSHILWNVFRMLCAKCT
jgi:hypothetical protein